MPKLESDDPEESIGWKWIISIALVGVLIVALWASTPWLMTFYFGVEAPAQAQGGDLWERMSI